MPTVDQITARLRAAGSVFAEEEAALLVEAEAEGNDLLTLLERRLTGEPLEYVLGWAAFRGLRIRVTDGVFVPRLRSGLLVDETLRCAPAAVLDLCCGSGAVGRAVEVARPDALVVAADIDPGAVACARSNLAHPERVFEGDLFQALPKEFLGRFDVIVANAPYVPTDEIAFLPREARLHEPSTALDGGVDGVAFHRRIADGAGAWLAPSACCSSRRASGKRH